MAEAFPSLPRNGMFELPLRASSSTDKGRFTHRITVLQERLLGQEQCHQNAIHNLIGVLQFYMGHKTKALSQFKNVLKSDPMNLNALGNSSFVYRRLGRLSKASEMDNRLEKMLEVEAQEDPALFFVLQGRLWAEQAHALSSELIEGTRHKDFDLESNKFYERAFRLAEQHFEEAELRAWKFSAGLNYKRLSMKLDTPKTDRRESFDRSLELFFQAINTSESPYIADCWCQIGILINAAKGSELYSEGEIPSAVKQYQIENYYNRPEECYRKALDKDPDNWHFANGYVRFLLQTKKSEKLQQALQTIQHSLKLNPERSNWLGYSTRAELCRKCSLEENSYLSEEGKGICDLLGWDSEAKPHMEEIGEIGTLDVARHTEVINMLKHELLLHAEEDISNVLAWNPTPKAYLVHGQISYDLACSEKRRGFPFEERMEQALEMFQHAVDKAMQGQERLPHVHAAHGKCLRYMGEYRNAAEAYKLVLETSSSYTYSRAALVQVVDNLMFVYEQEQTISALYETVHWFLRTCEKYQHTDFLKHLRIDKLRINHPQALRTMIQLMRDTNFEDILISRLDCATALENKARFRTPGARSAQTFPVKTGHFTGPEFEPVTAWHQNTIQSSQQPLSQLKDDSAAKAPKSEVRSVSHKVPRILKGSPHVPSKNDDSQSVSVNAKDNDVECPPPEDSGRTVPEVGDPPQGARNRKGKTYDFFVSHSGEDKYWVYFDLVPKLEREYNFKGCIDERDFTPGEDILKNIEDCMDQSVCTLLILTKAFYESTWCRHEKKEALSRRVDNDYPVIPIRVEKCDLPMDLSFITYLDAVERCDWEKLVRHLDNLMEL